MNVNFFDNNKAYKSTAKCKRQEKQTFECGKCYLM